MTRSRARRTVDDELIPGLPDCLALECLFRLPFHVILDARVVCKRWKHELDSPSFYRIRRAAGLAPRVVLLLLRGKLRHTVGKFHLALYEPATGVCTMRQLAPDRPAIQQLAPYRHFNMGNSDATVVGRELLVIGGWDVSKKRHTGEVHIYNLVSGAWRPGAPNLAPERDFYRLFLHGEKAFVVGGRNAKGKRLRSALAYDVATDTWIEIPDLRQDTCQGTFIDGNFWRNREEYNSAIELGRKWLLLDDEDDMRLSLNEEETEISVWAPGEKKSDGEKSEEKVLVTLNEHALGTLRQRLGIFPREVGPYLESCHIGNL